MQTRFQSIAAQVADSLRQEASASAGKALPSERELCRRLQVSRRTIRKALKFLHIEGSVKLVNGRNVATLRPQPKSGAEGPLQINLLLPEPLVRARPFTALWISHLTDLLRENGCRLEIISGEKYYGARAGQSLRQLTASHPARCWILARTNLPLQKWFHDNAIPAIVAGSTHSGLSLPSVDSDHGALARHAAANFIRHGHTRIALFLEKIRHAGDAETELEFANGMAASTNSEPSIIARIERVPEAVIREVKHLLALRSPPTAFLLCNSFSYLTLTSYLASLGKRIPQDFSVISQDEGPFLAHMYPNPARYITNPAKFARALNRSIKRIIANESLAHLHTRIMPDFIKGGSLAARRPSQS